MIPIDFPGSNVTYAKEQPEYNPLPAMRDEDGTIVSCWELTDAEVKAIIKHRKLYISIMTFNQPLQPIRPWVDEITIEEIKEELLKPLDINDFDGISRARAAYQQVCEALKLEGGEHLIKATQDIIDKDGMQNAWKFFKFEEKHVKEDVELFKNAFRYMEFTSPNKIFGESI